MNAAFAKGFSGSPRSERMNLRGSLALLGLLTIANAATATDAHNDEKSGGDIRVSSGPHAGKYSYVSEDACIFAPLKKGAAVSFSYVLITDESTLSIDIPDVDSKHLAEFQLELVITDAANKEDKRSRKRASHTLYTIDTRPDSALDPYQRKQRGANGAKGRGSVKLRDQGQALRVEFSGETIEGIKLEGSVRCRAVDRTFAP
jgi:hypothetical protein